MLWVLIWIARDAIQMGAHNICLYKEVVKKYTGCNLKTMELLDYALIGVYAVIKLNMVDLWPPERAWHAYWKTDLREGPKSLFLVTWLIFWSMSIQVNSAR